MDCSKDLISWYPMYATFGREMKVKMHLDDLGIESYVPMIWQWSDGPDAPCRQLVPALRSLIFVRSSQNKINQLKWFDRECSPLQYMTRPVSLFNNQREIITVDDRSMDNFLLATKSVSDKIEYLTMSDFLKKEGRSVRIISGAFTGVEGVIKRIQGNKVVVVMLKGVAAVAISHQPPSCLEFL